MLKMQASAPSYRTLRPLRAEVTTGFPVYKDLSAAMVGANNHPDETVAHVLAACSGYSYSSADTVAMIMARMGLANNRCQMISEYVDAMLIDATAFLVQSEDGRVVILSFRGTQPTNLINWLTDLDVDPAIAFIPFQGHAGSFGVHAGFYRNLRAIRFEVIAALLRAVEGRSVLLTEDGEQGDQNQLRGLEALYITGHSLGAAMAAIMAIMLVTDAAYRDIAAKLRAVYTFGQPMIGGPDLADACAANDLLSNQVLRFIYRHDFVPRLPPTDSGPFAHFGREYRYGSTWPWTNSPRPVGQMGSLFGLAQAPLAFLSRQVRALRRIPFEYSLEDHLPQNYVTALTPPGVPNEFGDDPLARVNEEHNVGKR